MYCELKDNIRLRNLSLNRSLRFLNRLFLDIAVIDLMSIVHVDKIWVEIVKNFEMRTSGGGGGGGGGGVVSDFGHPRTRGGGGEGVKIGQIFADVLYGWPLIQLHLYLVQEALVM